MPESPEVELVLISPVLILAASIEISPIGFVFPIAPVIFIAPVPAVPAKLLGLEIETLLTVPSMVIFAPAAPSSVVSRVTSVAKRTLSSIKIGCP